MRSLFQHPARCAALGALASTALLAASVTGRVELKDSRDAAVRRNGDRSGVVVWLEPRDPAVRLSGVASPRARMIQKNKRFTPHVLAVSVGTTVDFPNQDPIFHNAFSNFSGQLFDLSLYPPGTSRGILFGRAGVVRIFCNIHPAMSAVIVVVNTPYFTASNPEGAFTIDGVPPGDYRLRIFHERATAEALQALERHVTVRGSMVVPELVISESGYLPVPHKNKYGKDYPPATDDMNGYPATP